MKNIRLARSTADEIAAFLGGATATPEDVARWVAALAGADNTPEARRRRSAAAATRRWAAEPDRSAATSAGREAFLSRFESDDDRKAYFADLARRSAETRRRNAALRGDA